MTTLTQPEACALFALLDDLTGGNASCLLTPEDNPTDATPSALAKLFARAGKSHLVPDAVLLAVAAANRDAARQERWKRVEP